MFAIVRVGSQQFKVQAGDYIRTPFQNHLEKEEIDLPVVAFRSEKAFLFDSAGLKGAQARAMVVRQFLGKKVLVFKKKRRKGYRRTRGHRQKITELKIIKLCSPEGQISQVESTSKTSVKKAKAEGASKKASVKKVQAEGASKKASVKKVQAEGASKKASVKKVQAEGASKKASVKKVQAEGASKKASVKKVQAEGASKKAPVKKVQAEGASKKAPVKKAKAQKKSAGKTAKTSSNKTNKKL